MMLKMCKSKIHRATVTDADLNYEGSITIDMNLVDAARMHPWEMVQVLNLANGARIETYVIPGERGSGVICLNGAAARLFHPGDLVIIISTVWMDASEVSRFEPRVVFVDAKNQPVSS